MALEAVNYQQDPFIYGCIDYNYSAELGGFGVEEKVNVEQSPSESSPPSSVGQTPEGRRKRRRSKTLKELESQRMTHIEVERNRRRQMNDYLAILRSLMPPSYAQRGDQASIVGGAINFVKELEQLVQFLEAYKFMDRQEVRGVGSSTSDVFSNFFSFPQYWRNSSITMNAAIADIEVTMVETHASIRILAKKTPKQLIKMVAGFQSFCLNILHLNITTLDQSVLYSFSVKVEDECQLSTVNDIATAVHEMVGRIQQDST